MIINNSQIYTYCLEFSSHLQALCSLAFRFLYLDI